MRETEADTGEEQADETFEMEEEEYDDDGGL